MRQSLPKLSLIRLLYCPLISYNCPLLVIWWMDRKGVRYYCNTNDLGDNEIGARKKTK